MKEIKTKINTQAFKDAAKAIERFAKAVNEWSELVENRISELKQKSKLIKLSRKEIKELEDLQNFFNS